MNIAFCTYRKWAYDIAIGLLTCKNKPWSIVKTLGTDSQESPVDKLSTQGKIINPKDIIALYKEGWFNDIDVMLMYGWSWILPSELVKKKVCLALHPSPLPKYRGGSPIQHQIINGEKESAVTIFRMNSRIDAGLIYAQEPISFNGHLNEILEKMTANGITLSVKLLDEMIAGTLIPKKQNEAKATIFKRRKPIESEITCEMLLQKSSIYIYNFIRALEDPYPNAFVKLIDGKFAYIKKADLSYIPVGNVIKSDTLIKFNTNQLKKMEKISLLCKDKGYIVIKDIKLDEKITLRP